MKIEIEVPQAGESVTEAMISEWFKQDGERVRKDEVLLEFETDKANQEFFAPESGVLVIQVPQGEVVKVGQVIGYIDTEGGSEDAAPKTKSAEPEGTGERSETETRETEPEEDASKVMAPAARRIVTEERLDPASIEGTGKGGRITKEDAMKASKANRTEKTEAAQPKTEKAKSDEPEKKTKAPALDPEPEATEGERVVPMSMMRRRIAERLVSAQKSSAILTTFNEVDMTAVMAMRQKFKDAYEKKYGIRLGFMSFFVKACVEALKHVPEINARIDEHNIVYRDHYHIGVAVGSDKGLVVPVIRHADRLGFAGIEKTIADYASKAREGKISLEDLSGGTFTISNGGIYGSLLSTPILNPPQSGILGMHKIEKRPVVVDDQVVVRPMMYVALSYDHRIVDGKGAVTFLVRVKECIEEPGRIMLEI